MDSIDQKIKLLCTLGPSSMNERVIKRLDEIGVDVFRINLSHTKIDELAEKIAFIKNHTGKPVCLDTEGAQVRTAYVLNDQIILEENTRVKICRELREGNEQEFTLTPEVALGQIMVGDLVSIDFNSVLLRVIAKDEDGLMAEVISGGVIGSNKAVSIDRPITLPFMSPKDYEAIKVGKQFGINHFALSFTNCEEDVKKFREHVGCDAFIISKIESKKGVADVENIAKHADALLIDRGDLSREEPIDKIPFIQKLIIQRAHAKNTPVYVATNLLESMVQNKKPTRAEVNDVVGTLLDGANGLVLAAETAIGKHPINCASMLSQIIRHVRTIRAGCSLEELQKRESYLLVEPHGGQLVNRFFPGGDPQQFANLKSLRVDTNTLIDLEQIAIGSFSPLEGFMNRQQLQSVLENYRLPNGTIWTLPILLQTSAEKSKNLTVGETITLQCENSAEIFGSIDLEDIYTYDFDSMCRAMFRTKDANHPGVTLLKNRGNVFLGGKIRLFKRIPSPYKSYEITPAQSRLVFEHKGWNRVVGFHTRNVIHRAHEYLQMNAYAKHHCDGLFIHPVIGMKKAGDYHADIILKSYELMIEQFYPRGKVLLGAFNTYSRYEGPREAVFTALCRKNFGCSHFIVGRDHTGVGNYYGPDESKDLFRELGNLGIEPIFFESMNYCEKCQEYVSHCNHPQHFRMQISGTECRKSLLAKKELPEWFMRKEISGLILEQLNSGKNVFL